MAVFRETVVTWEGQEYTLVPSNRMLRRIEREVPLWPLVGSLAAGNLRVSDVAFVVSEIMKEAGVSVTEDQIACDLHEGDPAASVKYAIETIYAILPGEPNAKKPDAQAEKE